jgi:uracil phosphoribosyltransferase
MRFRRNIERIGEIMAYELSKELHYKSVEIQTTRYKNTEIADQLVICSILRAGFPCTLVLNYFDAAQNGFISASRYHPNNDDYFEISGIPSYC